MIKEGYRFKTNKNINCVVIYNQFEDSYLIVSEDTHRVIATDKCQLIEKLVNTIINKF